MLSRNSTAVRLSWALASQHENIVQPLVILLHKIISQRTEDKAMRQPGQPPMRGATNVTHFPFPLVCRFSAAGMMLYLRAEAAGGRKAPRHEVAGSWAVASSECYGDLMSTPSLDGWRDANTTRPSCLPHGRSAECRRHFGEYSDRINARSVP